MKKDAARWVNIIGYFSLKNYNKMGLIKEEFYEAMTLFFKMKKII